MLRCFGRIAFLMLLPVGLSIAGGCASDKQVISQAADVHKSLSPAVIEDEVLVNYIQEVGDRIIEQAAKLSASGKAPKKHYEGDNSWMFGEGMRFHFVNSKTLNAFTTGGEHMYIYTQLFVECKSEDELAAVMAHEFAHIYGRHVQKGMDRQIAALVGGAVVGGAAGYALGGDDNKTGAALAGAGIGIAGGQFLNMGFTRADESEADKYGFRFYTRAGWDPEKFDGFFRSMIEKGYDKTPEILSDHPSLKNRVKTLEEYVRNLPPEAAEWRRDPVAGPKRFRELQQRALRVGKGMPSDSSLENSQELLQALPRSCVTPIPQFQDQREAQEHLMRKAQAKSD
jgi:predicted Zn-dependent protease